MNIDINSDLGEHYGPWRMGDDESMLRIVSSANVACGFHAGDPKTMVATLREAVRNGVSVGAHVSYADLRGFGREPMDPPAEELFADVAYQIGALKAVAAAVGTTVNYVKPHGALYNTIAHNEHQAAIVIDAIKSVDPELALMVLAGTPLVEQARAAGLRAVPEAFADRNYESDGTLVSRRDPEAVLHDPDLVASRMLSLVQEGTLSARDGSTVTVEAESICVHGDSAGAVDMARALRSTLEVAGVDVTPFAERA